MISTCANPACQAPFDYRQGELFRFHKSHRPDERAAQYAFRPAFLALRKMLETVHPRLLGRTRCLSPSSSRNSRIGRNRPVRRRRLASFACIFAAWSDAHRKTRGARHPSSRLRSWMPCPALHRATLLCSEVPPVFPSAPNRQNRACRLRNNLVYRCDRQMRCRPRHAFFRLHS